MAIKNVAIKTKPGAAQRVQSGGGVEIYLKRIFFFVFGEL